MEQEIDWVEYNILLAVALDLEERERFHRFVLAGGDPKKFRWSSPDKAGTEDVVDQGEFWAKTISRAGVAPMRGDIGRIATAGWERIKQVVETTSDGVTNTRYLNEDGKDITRRVEQKMASGEYFMKTKMKAGE